jgi:hypothetical protein
MTAELRSWATVRQLEFLDAIEANGSNRKAAKALGVNPRTLEKSIALLKAKAAQQGYSPAHDMTHTVPDGFKVKGVSTYYDEEGKARGQWVKSSADQEARERMLRQFVEDLCAEVKGKSPKIEPPTFTNADMLAVYPIGDMHHGMYADAGETGDADYDCKIASTALERAVDYLASITPPSEDALLINVGDYLHGNDSSNETPGHGNRLDVDTRYGQVMHSAGLSLVRAIQRLLTKHQRVIFWCMRGNHDPDAAPALALAVSFYFHNEPRVVVDLGTSLYKYMRFGQNLIGSHHGHGAKGADLPLIMATDRKHDWGETTYRVWHCGHIHHKTAKEYPGCVVETHRTLAPQDAWAAGKGYRAQSDMNAIVYHREHGEIQRSRFDMSMVQR